MHEKKAHEILSRHNINIADVRDGKTTLHHLRHIVKGENQPFGVFRELVKLRK